MELALFVPIGSLPVWIYGVVVGVALFLVVVILLLIVWYRRRVKREKQKAAAKQKVRFTP